MRERGELATYPGRVTPAGEFLTDCAARLKGSRIVAAAGADRYQAQAEVEQALWPNASSVLANALARHRGQQDGRRLA